MRLRRLPFLTVRLHPHLGQMGFGSVLIEKWAAVDCGMTVAVGMEVGFRGGKRWCDCCRKVKSGGRGRRDPTQWYRRFAESSIAGCSGHRVLRGVGIWFVVMFGPRILPAGVRKSRAEPRLFRVWGASGTSGLGGGYRAAVVGRPPSTAGLGGGCVTLGFRPQVSRRNAYPGKLLLPVERDVARGADEQRDPLAGIDTLDDATEDEGLCWRIPVKIEQHEVVATSLEESSRLVEVLGSVHVNAFFPQHSGTRVTRRWEPVNQEDSFASVR